MEALVATLLLIAAIFLLLLIICHLLGPKSDEWTKTSAKEEKITLSNTKLFNTNGYLMQSNSEILLGSTRGSFKRFESVDSAANQPNYGQSNHNQPSGGVIIPTQPLWDTRIPPMPSRTPPKPPAKLRSVDEKMQRQSSLKTPLTAPMVMTNNSSAIPRPSPKKQLSAPTSSSILPLTPPVPTHKKRSPIKKQSTNPFLNYEEGAQLELPKSGKNPFIDDHEEEIFSFEPTRLQPFIEDTQDPLRQVEARISKLESIRRQRATETSEEVLLNTSTATSLPISTSNYSFKMERLESKSKAELLNHIKEMSSSLDSTIADLTNSLKCLDSVGVTDNHHTSSFQSNRHITPPLRSRSLSETQVEEFTNCFSDQESDQESTSLSTSNNNNPFHTGSILHKTPSDMYLEHYSGSVQSLSMPRSGKNYNLAQIEVSAGVETSGTLPSGGGSSGARVLLRQNSFGKPGPDATNNQSCDTNNSALKRAISCDSVSSESSVVLGDLEQIAPPVTGSMCIGLQYDKVNATEDGCELFVTILEAKDLICPEATEGMDTFVRIYLVPDERANFGPSQTKIFKNSKSPSYQETFSFWIDKTSNKPVKRSLWFHLYHTSSRAHTLIGEAELKLTETSRPITLWLTLTDSRHNHYSWGELMFSLSYLPTAERLTVVVVKARNLKIPTSDKTIVSSQELHNVFVKVYLLKSDKKVSKKKTSVKRGERCPIFNEAMMFSVPPYMLSSVQVRLTVVNISDNPIRSEAIVTPIGHVIVGSGTSGKGLKHWHQMLTTSLRKPVAMWHALRITQHRKGYEIGEH